MIPSLSPKTRGAALIIVLASLVFLAALALAFIVSVGSELKTSKQYAEGVNARLLAQSAFNLVNDQIAAGTRGYEGADPSNPGETLNWASQPGMIRTFDSRGEKGRYYKLYSWDVMQGTGAFDPTSPAEAVSPTWFQNPALYTDLNQPINVSGVRRYPIVDGKGLAGNVRDAAGANAVSGKTYDLDGDSRWDVEGFQLSDTTPIESGTANPVPMPVKWLYVLRDGQIIPPSSSSGRTVTFAGSIKPSKDNPIAGRIAFWTDDETSKVNLNTAAEGVYWDTPRVKSRQDDAFKVSQMTTGEYQRYPGHPAMTSLSTIIKPPVGWTPGSSPPTVKLGPQDAVNYRLTAEQWAENQWANRLYRIAPRIGEGGSAGGTEQTAMLLTGVAAPTMTLDADRFYAGVDELAFAPDRSLNNANLDNLPLLTKETLDRDRFFLTASSRAPDVNLFNEPRVCIWPIHATDDDAHRTPLDRLIAFCSTVNGFTYYFERENPNDPHADLGLGRNRKLLSYLRTLAGENIPGFGGNFAAKYPQDRDQIFTEIFDYIRSTNLRDPLLVNANEGLSTTYTKGIPGSGWWTSNPSQALNGIGQVVPIVDQATDTRGFGRFVSVDGASVLFIGQVDGDGPVCTFDANHNPVSPFPTAANTQADPVTGHPLPRWSGTAGTLVTDKVAPGHMRVQAVFLPQFFSPSVGAGWLHNNFQWSVDLSGLTLNGSPLEFPLNVSGTVPKRYTVNQRPKDETGFGDQLGLVLPIQSQKAGPNDPAQPGGNIVSAPVDVPKGTMTLAGQATVRIYAAAPVAAPGPSTVLLQTITLTFNGPPSNVPSLAADQVANKADNGKPKEEALKYMSYRFFNTPSGAAPGRYNSADPANPHPVQGGRFTGALDTSNAGGFFMQGDVVRSVRSVSGDNRLIAAQENPPGALFEPNPEPADLLGAHSFLTGYGHSYYGAAHGRLVKNLPYPGAPVATANEQTTADNFQNIFFETGFALAASTPLNGVEAGSATSIGSGVPGDWDNGPFAIRDGPYINKADEGDIGGGGPGPGDVKEPYHWKIKAQSKGKVTTSLFSPNRMIPSAVTFGSLPTGVKANAPWQTLLFRPEPGHPGSGRPVRTPAAPPYTTPPDHLLLELFSMPVVEPYAISEPLSTAGKINMNFQIVPFTYITRSTGIRSLLKSEKVIAIRDSQAEVYKRLKYSTPLQFDVRFAVNPEETLKGFQQRFDAGDIFRSASEICDLPIVPKDDPIASPSYPGSSLDTYETIAAYWDERRLTGDNSRERIYATLYPRLTTKSNTFTIHARVQTLKKVPGSPADTWNEDRDQVTGEFRGSQTIERYIDPNDSAIPDYASGGTVTPLSQFYKTRVTGSKQFTP